jgi:hypothetical protein
MTRVKENIQILLALHKVSNIWKIRKTNIEIRNKFKLQKLQIQNIRRNGGARHIDLLYLGHRYLRHRLKFSF